MNKAKMMVDFSTKQNKGHLAGEKKKNTFKGEIGIAAREDAILFVYFVNAAHRQAEERINANIKPMREEKTALSPCGYWESASQVTRKGSREDSWRRPPVKAIWQKRKNKAVLEWTENNCLKCILECSSSEFKKAKRFAFKAFNLFNSEFSFSL